MLTGELRSQRPEGLFSSAQVDAMIQVLNEIQLRAAA